MSDFEAMADPQPVTLTERAREASRRLGDMEDQQKTANETGAITLATKRAEELAVRLRSSATIASDLEALSVKTNPPVFGPSVAKAIRHLRTTATVADDPGQSLTERLRGSAVQDALKAAENAAKSIEQALINAADTERLSLKPSDLDSPVAALPGSESIQPKILRLRTIFSDRFKRDPFASLPETVKRWHTAAAEWKTLREGLEMSVAQLHPEIKAFVEAAASENGAQWSLLTPQVREWLDTDDNGEGYKVCKW